ncbi:MAG: hypothetical protein EU547_05440 [Promethearchaeota archaeon]|nr:MAG: hypothetical protein EU547_05440 [Candidatus Lokiarchaeota archaeon]
MFSLLFDPTTNTLEIYDLKPEADFGIINPGSHYVNHFMQLMLYALTMHKILGSDIKIRCIVFNKKGFTQFDPHKMYFTFLEFLTNFKDSRWNLFIETSISQMSGDESDDYREGYNEYDSKISPTEKYMKAFLSLWSSVNKDVIKKLYPLKHQWYLATVSRILSGFRTEVNK